MRIFHFLGGRVVKTGLAVFLTALICEIIGWPPVFAVITAIVTIEPTIADSIKKGIIRFPASAIGSAYAVLFLALFGNSAITYTLAAVFTIVTCSKLKLHAGLLVATLTSVAMVEVIQDNFFVSFLTRLGTTTVGLFVSTLVNMLIYPPNYQKDIHQNIEQIKRQTGFLIHLCFQPLLQGNKNKKKRWIQVLNRLTKKIQTTEQLLKYQEDEQSYHPIVKTERKEFQQAKKKLDYLRFLLYHLNHVIQTPFSNMTWTETEQVSILSAAENLAKTLQGNVDYDPDTHRRDLDNITDIFWKGNKKIMQNSQFYPTHFPPELILLYELVMMYEITERYYDKK